MSNRAVKTLPTVLAYEPVDLRPRVALFAVVGTLAAILATCASLLAVLLVVLQTHWVSVVVMSGIAAVLTTAAYWWLSDYVRPPRPK